METTAPTAEAETDQPLTITLHPAEHKTLLTLAKERRREPAEQAAWLLEGVLEKPPVPESKTTTDKAAKGKPGPKAAAA